MAANDDSASSLKLVLAWCLVPGGDSPALGRRPDHQERTESVPVAVAEATDHTGER